MSLNTANLSQDENRITVRTVEPPQPQRGDRPGKVWGEGVEIVPHGGADGNR